MDGFKAEFKEDLAEIKTDVAGIDEKVDGLGWEVSEDELSVFKDLDKRERAIDSLIQKLITEAEGVCEEREKWGRSRRKKYKITAETVHIDINTGIINVVKSKPGGRRT